MTTSKQIQIQDVRAGRIRETVLDAVGDYDPIEELRESLYRKVYGSDAASLTGRAATGRTGRRLSLMEAFVATPDSANMLRDGIRFLSFTAYAEQPQSFQPFTTFLPSNRPQEEYLRDAVIGALPKVKSGAAAPTLLSSFEGGVTLVNTRYAGIVEVTGDDIRFDRLGKIRQIAAELGRAARMTEEQAVYADLTNTANYIRSNTTNDNDIGANTQTLTFNAANLETAFTIITTSKDRKSGSYLGLMPDTLICGPRLEFAVKQLLMSDNVQRVGGNTTNETRGTGTTNVYRGVIGNVIISPWFGASYQWGLVDSKRTGYVLQQVEPFNVYQEAPDASSESWLTRDVTRYLVQGYFGSGLTDDRVAFYSDSNTQPSVS